MAQQEEEGWPLGLQSLVLRAGSTGAISLNNFFTASVSPSSSGSSSDFDSESTGSFFHGNGITLGSLIGVSSMLNLSRKQVRGRKIEHVKEKKSYRSKTRLLSLCSRDITSDDGSGNNSNNPTTSLGHFLAVERRAANENRST